MSVVRPRAPVTPLPTRKPLSPEAGEVLAEMVKHPALAEVATLDRAEAATTLLATLGLTLADLLTGIRELAGEATMRSGGLPRADLERGIRTYAQRAKQNRERAVLQRRQGAAPVQPAPPGGSNWSSKAANAPKPAEAPKAAS